MAKADEDIAPRIIRHTLLDRVFHWIMAGSVITLLVTSFLPILGIKFSWLTIHWSTGLVLTVLVVFHIFWVFIRQDFWSMWFGLRDVKESITTLSWLFKLTDKTAPKPGKYSAAQKLMHHTVSIVILITIVTGLLMMVKIDTPFWERDPYWLSDNVWGVIYFFHGIASLSLITIIIIHIYFALRPEKLMYTRSMILGWLTKDECLEQHDINRWKDNAQ
jgi:cytochrome b subunit of formate dehydrogenase